MSLPFHVIIEGNSVVIYASRNGSPAKVLPTLQPFVQTFCQERELCGEYADTPECLTAQILVRFGFEICEDDYSHLKVGTQYNPSVSYIYQVAINGKINVWVPKPEYRENPSLGLKACYLWQPEPVSI
ncbi:MAG: histidine kinase [Cyanobacteria bacterium LVE1205-1]|jgi:hypothetical protein